MTDLQRLCAELETARTAAHAALNALNAKDSGRMGRIAQAARACERAASLAGAIAERLSEESILGTLNEGGYIESRRGRLATNGGGGI